MLKAFIEALFKKLCSPGLTMQRQKTQQVTHPGRTVCLLWLDGQTIGFLGQVHPQTAKNYGIPGKLMWLKLILVLSRRRLETSLQPFVEIAHFAVSRDIALLLKADITHQEVLDAIYSAGVKHLIAVKLFDVYAGEKLGAGMKSMAYSLTLPKSKMDNLTDEGSCQYMEKLPKLSLKSDRSRSNVNS
ncbi:MAG: hypothetical protein ACLR70_04235 [Streptococcus thermophilus]